MSDADAAEKLVESIRPLLAGQPPHTQAAALADLLAIWLAGHVIHGNPAATDKLREELLEAHIEVVRELIPINAREMHGDPRRFS